MHINDQDFDKMLVVDFFKATRPTFQAVLFLPGIVKNVGRKSMEATVEFLWCTLSGKALEWTEICSTWLKSPGRSRYLGKGDFYIHF